ncbi:hypothetical protein PHISP_06911 [Aspergillus sp. HF37]|nr:hypothetical protein PHISP_06911 [Aspergillus sp. HF37]
MDIASKRVIVAAIVGRVVLLSTAHRTSLPQQISQSPTRSRRRENRVNRSDHPLELAPEDGSGEFDDDPLDDTGVDLSEIPEDFDKADGTIVRRERIEARWNRSVTPAEFNYIKPSEPKWREPEDALRQASNNDMYRFLGWCLRLQRGKEGRRLKGIHKFSSLEADWKNFRGYYQKITKTRIGSENGQEVRRGIKYLAKENALDTQPRKKTPVYIEDMTPFKETILATQEKRFDLSFQRIQVDLLNTLGLFTLHREGALLALQFKHLLLPGLVPKAMLET